ncbi:nuclear factor of activated T-cells 5 isoform X2 [Cimex lectularius]|nr:nuclear factor of activated T-cells 5 isoform X2 [Cimex lectularius]
MQHRARYQTEGSRGAVKDRTGNSFPIVKLTGYNKPATLEVYIGTDQGRVAPHMFYQACRVSGKNSTPCVEKKVNGTVLIEIELDPSKDMIATCDCVGILKERNVDVEHRFPEESSGRSKKKSTRCRMVFRTVITNDDNIPETLQVTSQPIICTQPPGVPEICKKSLSSCPAAGGLELFILGKNFLKDTKVVFSEGEFGTDSYWEAFVQPDKEFLQQSHLVCVVPAYRQEHIKESVAVRLNVISSERSSEAHTFMYTPIGTSHMQALTQEPNIVNRAIAPTISSVPAFPGQNLLLGMPLMIPPNHISMASPPFVADDTAKCKEEKDIPPVMLMPPPTVLPSRRGSQPMIISESSVELKREAESPSPTQTIPVTADLSTSQTPSMATLRRFVSTPNTPLPALSVETYFSRIENKQIATDTSSPLHPQKSPTINMILSSRKISPTLNSVYTPPISQQTVLLQNGIASDDILRPQTLQDQITASIIANREQEAAKLDAFVNSTAENHLNSPQSLETSQPSAIPKQEIILNDVLSDVTPVPMQTSPLNLNTNETLSPSALVSMKHMVPMDSKIPSTTLPICTLPQSSLPINTAMLTNSLVNESGDLILNQSFSSGKDIRTVTDTISINGSSISTTNFNDANVTQVTTSPDLIMNAVVNDLSNCPQFTSGQELPMQSSIKECIATQSQLQDPLILPSVFPTTTSANNSSINNPMNTDFIGSQPLRESSQSLSSPSQFSGNLLNTNYVQDAVIRNKETTQQVENSLSPRADNKFTSDIVFSPTNVNDNLNVTLKTTQSSPQFTQDIVFTSTPELPIGREAISGIANSGFQTVTENVDIKPELFSSELNNSSFQGGRNGQDPILTGTQSLNITNTKLEPEQTTSTNTFQSEVILNSFTTSDGPSAISIQRKSIDQHIPTTVISASQVIENRTAEIPKVVQNGGTAQVKKCEEGIPLPQELTQMSEHDLLSYINPSCFDQV